MGSKFQINEKILFSEHFSMSKVVVGFLYIFVLLSCFVTECYSLMPEELLVIANTQMSGSVEIAEYYMEKRNIPKKHLLQLSLPVKETISQDEYNHQLRQPVFEAITRFRPEVRISAIVLIYGVPLKVTSEKVEQDLEKNNKISVEQKNNNRRKNKKTIEKKERDGEVADQINHAKNLSELAAVDSELALAMVDNYELAGWVRNPYFIGFQGMQLPIKKSQVMLVSRLDGPDVRTVYRIIDDSLRTEKTGLQGTAYFDARWQLLKKKDLSGYRLYDASLHRAAKAVSKRMDVKLDEKSQLFAENSCPEAALYCGWYSLAKYVDSFQWQRGAVGYHLASAECTTLKRKESKTWCLKMLEKGVAATIGPVNEPYIQGFPLPEIFFSYLVDGYMSLGESYLVSLPFISWQMILVGDPLYQPFPPSKY